MPQIPLSQRTQQAGVVSQPRASASAAAAPWQAVAQAGQAISGVGKQIAVHQKQKQEKINKFNAKMAEESDKANLARLGNTLDNSWNAAKDTMAGMTDPKEIKKFYDELTEKHQGLLDDVELSPSAKIEAETKLLNMQEISKHAVTGPSGFMNKANIQLMDNVYVEQEQMALNNGNEDMYAAALEARKDLGTVDQEYYSKGMRKFGQEVYYRKAYKGLDLNYEATVESVDPDKMSAEQFGQYMTHKTEVENKIETKSGEITDNTYKTFNAEAKRGELSTADLERARSEPVEVYAGVTALPLDEADYDALKATIVGQVSIDRDTSQYIAAHDLMAKKLSKGEVDRKDMNEVLRMMTKSKKARFTTQTNLDLLDEIESMFQVGKRYDPSATKWAFNITKTHGEAIAQLVDGYKQQVGRVASEDPEVFAGFKSHVSSLMNLFDEKGGDLTKEDVSEWRKVEMGDIDLENAEQEQRRAAFPDRAAFGLKEGKTIVKTGKKNGRTVVKYSDGSIEYGD